MYLTNGRLTIRNAVASDADQLCAWWNDGAVMAHAGFPNGLGTTADEVRESLAADTDEKGRRHIIELDGCAIGEMNYRRVAADTAEIGIKICDFSEQDKGYGTQLLTMFINGLFEQPGYDRIILDTNVKNLRAQHIYEKLGFQRVAVRENSWADQLGEPQSAIDYELPHEIWIN